MDDDAKIQWRDHMINPWRGCAKANPGCADCYAEAGSKRNPAVLGVWGPNGTRVVAAAPQWTAVERWDRDAAKAGERRRVFVASLADVFEDWRGPMVTARGTRIGSEFTSMADVRSLLFGLIDDCPNLDFLLVTKRPENVRRMWPGRRRGNVWLLTSVEDQATADRRVPELLRLGDLAPVLGLSMEPLLGPVNLNRVEYRIPDSMGITVGGVLGDTDGETFSPRHKGKGLDWVIVGGESGHGARPCDVGWVRSIVEQCQDAAVPVFVKQLGSQAQRSSPYIAPDIRSIAILDLKDRKGGDPAEWPEDLRVREFPRTNA